MTNRPLISILIPTYNREKYIEACLDSVLLQEFSDFEIICSDNCSTDSTWSILQAYAARDPRIRLLRNNSNLGAIPNWKRCLENARGHFVHWLWSDDWIENFFYPRATDAIKKLNCGMVVCSALVRVENQPSRRLYDFSDGVVPGHRACQHFLRSQAWPVSPVCALIKRESALRHFYDVIPGATGQKCVQTAIGPDLLMLAGGALEAGRVATISEPLVNFRLHAGSITQVQKAVLRQRYVYAVGHFLSVVRLSLPKSERFFHVARLLRHRELRQAARVATYIADDCNLHKPQP